MSLHDPQKYLKDMLNSCEFLIQVVKTLTMELTTLARLGLIETAYYIRGQRAPAGGSGSDALDEARQILLAEPRGQRQRDGQRQPPGHPACTAKRQDLGVPPQAARL